MFIDDCNSNFACFGQQFRRNWKSKWAKLLTKTGEIEMRQK